jgi:hypothetical protein
MDVEPVVGLLEVSDFPILEVLPMRFRKSTKQLATLGPASSSFEMIEKLFLSGKNLHLSRFVELRE